MINNNNSFCPCFPCAARVSRLPAIEKVDNTIDCPFNNNNLPNELILLIFAHLGKEDLLSSSIVCKNWRIFIATNLYPNGQCFYKRRHMIVLDVSRSMGNPLAEGSFAATAIQVAKNLAARLELVIKRQGIFVGKFAERTELRHCRSLKKIGAYIRENHNLGMNTNFDVMLKDIMEKFKQLENKKKTKKELIIHLLTDLLMNEKHFEPISDRNELKTLPFKISLMCYSLANDERSRKLQDQLMAGYSEIKDEAVEGLPKRKRKRKIFNRDRAHLGFVDRKTINMLKKKAKVEEEKKDSDSETDVAPMDLE